MADDAKNQDKAKVDFKDFAQCLSLEELALEECHLVVNKRKDGERGSLDINFSVDGVLDDDENPTKYYANCKGVFKALTKSDETYFDLTVVYTASYACKEVFNWPKEQIEYFSNRNVIIHAWPYIREIVDQMTRRANVGRVLLPLIPMPVKKQSKSSDN